MSSDVVEAPIIPPCPKCNSTNTRKFSAAPSGSPRLMCKDCGKASVYKGQGKVDGRKPLGDRAMTSKERDAKLRVYASGLRPDLLALLGPLPPEAWPKLAKCIAQSSRAIRRSELEAIKAAERLNALLAEYGVDFSPENKA